MRHPGFGGIPPVDNASEQVDGDGTLILSAFVTTCRRGA
jgi:hypothetical protein